VRRKQWVGARGGCSCAARGEGGADEDRTHRWAACPSGPHGGLARSEEHWATAAASTRQAEKHGVFASHFQKRHQAPKTITDLFLSVVQ
jgi:hypothetical protein